MYIYICIYIYITVYEAQLVNASDTQAVCRGFEPQPDDYNIFRPIGLTIIFRSDRKLFCIHK